MATAIVVVAIVAAGCDRQTPEAAPTTTRPLITTTAVSSSTSSSTTSTSEPPALTVGSFPEYRIGHRDADVGNGDSVIALLDAATYDGLTDLDLYDLIADIVERFPPIYEAHLVDDMSAVDALLTEEPTSVDESALRGHYLARLEEGFRIVYEGPFSDRRFAILGS